ncbi:hypothetical protein [Nitrospirillum iridis]|uniref:Uncharacterized protein n=1 Tax=Nitrospirillum iridis TaxID=765888 RepID=A0A7X0EEU6_9PROT|nr:hypothetical protein [Nitrospirillum iridis]MBB6254248.1 hypothetical protein [Nitrospirillum iridis]
MVSFGWRACPTPAPGAPYGGREPLVCRGHGQATLTAPPRPAAVRRVGTAAPIRQRGKGAPARLPARAPASAPFTPKARLHMAAAGLVIAGAALILLSPALWAAIGAVLLFLAAAGTLVWARRQA